MAIYKSTHRVVDRDGQEENVADDGERYPKHEEWSTLAGLVTVDGSSHSREERQDVG